MAVELCIFTANYNIFCMIYFLKNELHLIVIHLHNILKMQIETFSELTDTGVIQKDL